MLKVAASMVVADNQQEETSRGKRKWRLVSQWEKEETDYEIHLRITERKKRKEKQESDKAIKKLKEEGKVQSIAGFLVCKEDEEDDWTKSKKENFQRNRSS